MPDPDFNHPDDDRAQRNANLRIGASDPMPSPYWHTRGYLPYFESPDVIQHVTFHLADSFPQEVLLLIEEDLRLLPEAKRAGVSRQRMQDYLDAGYGSCVLREREIAAMMQATLQHHDNERYRLDAWVVMPNHVHVLLLPLNGWTVRKIVASWKKFSATRIVDWRLRRDANTEIGVPVWHREYWDRYIRDATHYERAVRYIVENPVKAGLVAEPERWPWSSAAQDECA